MTKIKIEDAPSELWEWCRDNLEIGSWKMMLPIMGNSATYCFDKEEDATAFKLVFGL